MRMKNVTLTLLLFLAGSSFAQQKETFDLATYTVPNGWKKTSNTTNVVGYAITNNQKGAYCQIGIYASTASKGNLQADFESEWQELVVKPYKPTTKPELTPSASENGWDAQIGAAPFEFSGAQAVAMLVTATSNGRCISILIMTNTDAYQAEIERFLGSVDLRKIEPTSQPNNNPVGQSVGPQKQPTITEVKSEFAFTTINFDDGWVSTVQEDWVEVTKSNLKVLIHYPNPTTSEYISDADEAKRVAWNTLVAPRYNNLQNYFIAKSGISYIQGSFISGTLTDNKTGQTFYVALFKRDKSPWMEFIAPNITAFGQVTGFNIGVLNGPVENEAWDPLQKLEGYNKFAVAASDLKGKWTTNFSGMTQYVNIYTGLDAGATSYSSTQSFQFTDNTYHWELATAGGMVGNLKFDGAKSDGTFSVPNNWQIHFSDLEGKPKLYNAYFSCIKGARILWLEDTGYATGYTGYGKIE